MDQVKSPFQLTYPHQQVAFGRSPVGIHQQCRPGGIGNDSALYRFHGKGKPDGKLVNHGIGVQLLLPLLSSCFHFGRLTRSHGNGDDFHGQNLRVAGQALGEVEVEDPVGYCNAPGFFKGPHRPAGFSEDVVVRELLDALQTYIELTGAYSHCNLITTIDFGKMQRHVKGAVARGLALLESRPGAASLVEGVLVGVEHLAGYGRGRGAVGIVHIGREPFAGIGGSKGVSVIYFNGSVGRQPGTGNSSL